MSQETIRQLVTLLVGVGVVLLSAVVPELAEHLEIIAPTVVTIILVLLGVPAAERATTSVAQAVSNRTVTHIQRNEDPNS